MPRKDAIIVGTENTIVIPARNFMITFKLLDIIELYVSIVDDKISLYINFMKRELLMKCGAHNGN